MAAAGGAELEREIEELEQEIARLKERIGRYSAGLDPEQRAGAPEDSPGIQALESDLERAVMQLSKLRASAQPAVGPQPAAATATPPPTTSTAEDPLRTALAGRRLVRLRSIVELPSFQASDQRYVSHSVGSFLNGAAFVAQQRAKTAPVIVEVEDLLWALLSGMALNDKAEANLWHHRLARLPEIAPALPLIAEFEVKVPSLDLLGPSDALAGTSLIDVLCAASDLRRRTNSRWHDIGTRHVLSAALTTAAGREAMHRVGLFGNGFARFRNSYCQFLVESRVVEYGDELASWTVIADQLRAITWHPPGRERTKVASDGATIVDSFNAKADADALAELVTLESTGTPMAIGIFGHWGAGKSTLMRLVEDSVDRLAADERKLRGKDSWFRADDKREADLRRIANVVQIRFNAWTYADSDNLWASLTAEFFDQLSAGGAGEWLGGARGLRIVKEIATRVAEERKVGAKSDDLIADARRDLEQAEAALAGAEKRMETIDTNAAVDALAAQLGAALDKSNPGRDPLLVALPALGVDAAALGVKPPSRFLPDAERQERKEQMAAAFSRTVLDFARAPGDVSRLLRSLPHLARRSAWARWSNLSWRLVVFFGLAVTLTVGLLSVQNPTGLFDYLKDGALWGLLGAVAGAIHFLVRSVVPMFRLLNDFEERRATRSAEIGKEIAALRATVRERQDRLAELTKARDRALTFTSTYEAAARGDSPAMTLQYLLQESADLNAVRAKLGFLATVRRCFEHLEDLIRKGRQHAIESATATVSNDAVARIDRVVLYIDDLDRCSEVKVVQVLEAIHLLLAFEFFVVIVAVDPRWLRLALASHYAKQLAAVDGRAPDGLRPTVSDYVEKIFQIPFLVRSLAEDDHAGYRSFLEGLVEGQIERPPAKDRQPDADAPLPPAGTLAGGLQFVSQPEGYVAPGGRSDAERKLLLSDAEVSLLQALGPLAAKSPRAVKRMMNIYRLMRVRLSGSDLGDFLDDAGGGVPRFRAVAFALACEVGLHPVTLAAMERVIALALRLTETATSTRAEAPFDNALSERWLDHERALRRNGVATARPDNDDYDIVVALAEALMAENKTAVLSAAIAAVTAAQGNRPLTAADLAAAFHEVRRYSFRS